MAAMTLSTFPRPSNPEPPSRDDTVNDANLGEAAAREDF